MFDGQFQLGITPLHKALAMHERHYPAEHLNIGIAHGNMGWAMIMSRPYRQAHEHLTIACDIFARQLGESAPQTLDCHKKLNITLKHLCRLPREKMHHFTSLAWPKPTSESPSLFSRSIFHGTYRTYLVSRQSNDRRQADHL
ncbi:hypothetical protein L0Y47_16810 [Ectopseudomonas composti]